MNRSTFSTHCRYFKIASMLLLICWSFSGWAAWMNVPGFQLQDGTLLCPNTVTSKSTLYHIDTNTKAIYTCPFEIPDGNGVSTSGEYIVIMYATSVPGEPSSEVYDAGSTGGYVTSDKQLNDQNITFAPYSTRNYYQNVDVYICWVLSGKAFNNFPSSCNAEVLPPGPDYLSCAFNQGGSLEVGLGEVDRSAIGTSAGTSPQVEKSLDVTCTGNGTVTYSVQFEYTPITAGSDELITTTANGLGVAMSFNDAPVKTTDKITRTYSTGTQTERLAFEPVRNPAVQASDIPTGAFTASAVMVLTEE